VFLLGRSEDVGADAGTNLRVLEALGVEVVDVPDDAGAAAEMLTPAVAKANLIIDALLGTGTRGAVREPYATAIEAINGAEAARVLAVDIPSGLECDSGRPLGPTVRADRTVTMAAIKAGFREESAREFFGKVVLADIGVPFERITAEPDGEEE
jgi:NAD(P)H-hydrate epimerase